MFQTVPVWDVVTLGETMLRLTPPNSLRLEQSPTLEVEIGGSESNTAAGLSRLGKKALWISRLPAHALGQRVARGIAAHGVDVSGVVWTEADRVGTYFYEEGPAPRGSSVIYDRFGSAMSRMQVSDLDQSLFANGRAQLLHLTGITLALGESPRAVCRKALELSVSAGWKLSFDLNYRSKLWSPQASRKGCELFVAAADILFAPIRDVVTIYDLSPTSTPEDVVKFLRMINAKALIVLTAGAAGAYAAVGSNLVHQGVFPASGIGRLGGGDAFSAGFLAAYLDAPSDLQGALMFAAAAAALKYSTRGDMPYFSRNELLQLIADGTGSSGVNR